MNKWLNTYKTSFLKVHFLLLIAMFSNATLANTTSSINENVALIKSKNDLRKYKFLTLQNGLEVVLVSDPKLTKSSVALAVNVGSYNESNGFWGMAHYLEHMLFLGTKKYPEEGSYNQFIAANGGKNNAYTYMDHTNYMVSINDLAFDELLDRFADYFRSPLLSKKYINKERHAVHSEWSMKGVYDGVILGHINGLTLNPEHPVSNFTWGNLSTLKDNKRVSLHQATVNFFNKEYSSHKMKVAMISNRKIDQLEKLAVQYFSNIPKRGDQNFVIDEPAITKNQMKKLIRYNPKKQLKKIQLKFVIKNNLAQFKTKPNYFITYLLNNQMDGTLIDMLKSEGLITQLYAWSDAKAFTNAGEFVIDIDLTDKGLKHRNIIVNSVFKYLTLIAKQGVNSRYFDEIKKSLSNAFEYQGKYEPYSYAADLAANMIHFPKQNLLNHQYVLESFNENHIHDVLSQLTLNSARVFFIDKTQYPRKSLKYFDAKFDVEPISATQEAFWLNDDIGVQVKLPKLNSLMPTNFAIKKAIYKGKPKRFISSLGSLTFLKNSTDFKEPKGKILVNLNSEIAADSAKRQVLLMVLREAVLNKFGPLASEASAAGMYLNLTQDRGLNFISSGYAEQQPLLLVTAVNHLRQLSMKKAKLDAFKEKVSSLIVNRKQNALYTQAFDYYNQFISKSDFDIDELLLAVKGISLADFTLFVEKYLSTLRLNTFAYGNFDETEVIDLVDDLEALLYVDGKARLNQIFLNTYQQFKKADKKFINIDAEQPGVALIDAKWQPHSLKREATAKVLQRIVSPALFKQIRTEEQLGYSVGFYSAVRGQQITYSWYVQTPVKSPKDIFQRVNLFKSKFMKNIEQISEHELSEIKKALLSALIEPHQNIYEEQYQFYMDWQRGVYQFDSKEKLVEAISKVSIEDIRLLYKTIVEDNDLARVVTQVKGDDFKDAAFLHF